MIDASVKIQHIPTCAELRRKPCTAGKSFNGEPVDQHHFSGWPGAYCLKCYEDDVEEICIKGGCKCPCHDEFWKAYNEACQ